MRRILAVIESKTLLSKLNEDYEITFCYSAEAATESLHQEYDGMILDLFLPGTDGLTLLEQIQDRIPPVVLILTKLLTPYIIQSVETLCGGYILRIPCSDLEIWHRLEDMFQKFDSPVPDRSVSTARYHIHRLGLRSGKGLQRMMKILPYYDSDANPSLFNDFYPDLSKEESVTMDAIDNSIHRTILKAYERRNDAVWKEYFPDTSKCPTNKEFFSAVAELIKSKDPSR